MIKKIMSVFLLALLTVVAILFVKSGAYKSADIEPNNNPPQLQLYFITHIGPYHEVVSDIQKVENEFEKLKIKCPFTFGIYLDNPELVDHDKLRSRVGCAFPIDQAPQLFQLPEGLSEDLFDIEKSSQPSFCVKGSFSGSPSLTAMKVYPKITKVLEDKRLKALPFSLELYQENKNGFLTTVYMCGQ